MGILSSLLIYILLERKRFNHPVYQLSKLLLIIISALVIGLLPYVDNYAHIGGLVTGVLLSAIFMPYYPPYEGEEWEVHKKDRKRCRRIKKYLVLICIPIFIVVFVTIFVLFYVVQPNCSGCQYITCVPLTDTICRDQQPTPDNRDMDLYIEGIDP